MSKPELANNGAHQPESESQRTSKTVIPASATVSAQAGTSEPPVESSRDGSAALPPMPAATGSVASEPGQVGKITLPEAIQTSFQMQPRLRVFLESIDEAQGHADVAFAPFLPTLSGGISGGGFDLDVTGQSQSFSFLPPGAVVPIGLDLASGYGFAEVRMQWLICDFGRRSGRYCQAELGVEIAQLQTDRAYQTVANEVTVAYYKVLQTMALRRIAQDAVRRADDDLGVAQARKRGRHRAGKGPADGSAAGSKPAATRKRRRRRRHRGRRAQPGDGRQCDLSDCRRGSGRDSASAELTWRVLAGSRVTTTRTGRRTHQRASGS